MADLTKPHVINKETHKKQSNQKFFSIFQKLLAQFEFDGRKLSQNSWSGGTNSGTEKKRLEAHSVHWQEQARYKKTILERPDGQDFTNQATSTSISQVLCLSLTLDCDARIGCKMDFSP